MDHMNVTQEQEDVTEAKSNGTATVNWKQLFAELSRPFAAKDVRWRAGGLSRDRAKAQALPYAEPRVYEDALNRLCAGNWSVTFRPWGPTRVICELTIHGITRASTGEGDGSPETIKGTAAEAQAFKRACSKFGLGRFLYDVPAVWVAYDADRKRFLEAPGLPDTLGRQARSEVQPSANGQPTNGATLTRERAAALKRELAKFALVAPREHKALAAEVAGRQVSSLTELTEREARRLLARARRAHDQRSLASREAEQSSKGEPAKPELPVRQES